MRYPDRRIRRFASAFAPALLVALALPLMAPTCGANSTGPKVFSKGSLIIPMDECYQNTPTTLTNTTYSAPYAGCPSNGATTYDAGNVLRAYGLVYQLLRNNIPVYWVINPNKTALLDTANPDITIALNGAAPVGKYQWGNPGVVGAMPPNNNTFGINYHGGPFVVDGSDAAAASAVMQSLKATFGATPPSTTNGPNLVNVHVSNVAFSATVAKSMSGGFQNSGGATPPPIALLNITGGDNKNSEVVIQGYLVDAGLGPADFAGAGGVATPTGHGKIYDDLYPADFLPVSCTTSCANGSPCVAGQCSPSLTYFGYSILWVPHWCAKGSANIPTGFGYLDILTQIRNFMNAGHDVMAECASLGAFEGVDNSTACNGAANTFDPGTGHIEATQVQTTTGVNVNETGLAGGLFRGPFPSPFLQLGDFPFTPVTGAIQQYSAAAAYVTRPAGFELMRLISDTTNGTKDYFTVLPTYGGMGTVVYLAGHDFSGGQGATPQLAGSRLVLNTLFNLGNACFASGATCDTGKLGVCAKGRMDCCGPTDTGCTVGQPFCRQTVFPSAEVCDGLDNDCNGAVDDIPPAQFYAYTPGTGDPPGPGCTGPAGGPYQCQGLCHPGVQSCVFPPPGVTPPPTPGTVVPLTVVSPQQTPVAEVCDGLDNDCDGVVDNGIAPRPCYDGTSGCTWNATTSRYDCLGTCAPGAQACVNGSFGLCSGEVLPAPELCEPLTDTNCNGIVGDGCSCVAGATRVCYTGAVGTANVGMCRSGLQTCDAYGRWPNDCPGEVVPAPRGCDAQDHDCDGVPDDQEVCGCVGGVPQPTGTRSCYDGPAGTANVGVCLPGTQTCSNGTWATACAGEIVPATVELCNGKNDTCSSTWTTDDGVGVCPQGLTCVNGSCVPSGCGTESFCPNGYTCNTTTLKCVPVNCAGATPANTPCPQGQVCLSGVCTDPCAGVSCGQGAFCTGGKCVGGGCLASGCPAGQLCLSGTCQADPCATVTCPSGTFCRPTSGQAYCVQSCAYVYCPAGPRGGADGFCVADPCNGVVCGAGQICSGSSCVADPCKGVTCGAGQACQGGDCVANPCAAPGYGGVSCPVGQCLGGQCYSSQNPTGAGGVSPPSLPPQTSEKTGCGCGGGGADGLALLLGLLAFPLSRRARRSRRPGGGALLLVALVALGGMGLGCGGKTQAGPCAATTCGSTCTDLKIDPANCGACGAACAAGQICVDSKCGPASAVAPYLTGLTPPSAPTGTSASVGVTGQRFQAGATVVALGVSAPIATTFVDSGHLTAQLDLTSVSPAAAQLRVVNPDQVISNGLPFDVTAAAPVVSTINPAQAVTRAGQPPGTTLSIAVAGSGFIPSSQCHLSGPGLPEQGLGTTYGSGTALQCALDLSTTQPGAYSLTVVNGAVDSNAVTFTVTSGTPALTGISPTGGMAGTVTSITASGSGFDATSQVLFDGAPFGITRFLGPGSLYAEPLNLAGVAVGPHAVTVRNGASGAPTAAQTFTVTAAAPVLNGVTVSPAPARQGRAGTLTLTGTGFDATSVIRILPPGGTAATLTPATQTATQLTASYTFAVAGSYSVSVVNGSLSSGALSVTAISNVALLAGISPMNGQQGQTVSLALTAANLDPGAAPTVHLAAPSLGCPAAPCSRDLTPSVSGNTLTVASLSLAGWDTGTFGVTVVNPGAVPSNGLGLTVTPGQPTVTGVNPTCAVQSGTPVPVALAGTNFAKPDANGNGGSAVHAASESCFTGTCVAPCTVLCAVPDFTLPAASVSVMGPGQIAVSFDTTLAVPDVYRLSVWNPGPTILKSSQVLTFTVKGTGTCP